MNKHLFRAAGAAGLLALAWVAAGYLRTNPLALAMTLVMAGFYVMGVLELHRFQQTTAGLDHALNSLASESAAPDALQNEGLQAWLAQVPAPLRTPVRLRVAGERAALPGPALAPYLAGLLVLLGMLGTFVGMVVTLNGTGLALEQASSVQSMRDSLAAPVRGLGLAFGTSVAGVAASAMLGLMSALCRRERQHAGQLLDSHTATTLQAYSNRNLRALQSQQRRADAQQLQQALLQQQHEATLALQRQLHETLQSTLHTNLQSTLQQQQAHQVQRDQLAQQQLAAALKLHEQQERQAQLLPALADRIHHLATQLEKETRQSAQALLASQQHFQVQAQQAYSDLAASVGQALQHSLHTSAQGAAAGIQAAVQDTMAGITRETAALHAQVAHTVQQQLLGFAQRFEAQSGRWLETAQGQAGQQSAALLQALAEAQAHQLAQQNIHDNQRMAALGTTLAAMAAQLENTNHSLHTQTQAQARSTLDELAQLVHTATEAPREAVQVMSEAVVQLRDKLSDSLARDNGMLQERARTLEALHTLLGAVQHTSTEQKTAIDQMVASTATWLQEAGARYTERVDAQSGRLETVSAQLTHSAVEVASLGEAFGAAVGLFSQSNGQVVAHMQRLEEALAKSSARSDDQLAYYVAQAREVIDLSLLAQKQIVDDLQRLASQQAVATPAVGLQPSGGIAGPDEAAATSDHASSHANNGISSSTSGIANNRPPSRASAKSDKSDKSDKPDKPVTPVAA